MESIIHPAILDGLSDAQCRVLLSDAGLACLQACAGRFGHPSPLVLVSYKRCAPR